MKRVLFIEICHHEFPFFYIAGNSRFFFLSGCCKARYRYNSFIFSYIEICLTSACRGILHLYCFIFSLFPPQVSPALSIFVR